MGIYSTRLNAGKNGRLFLYGNRKFIEIGAAVNPGLVLKSDLPFGKVFANA